MRKAFVTGSNGPLNLQPLKFAERDVQEVGGAFSSPRCGFETTVVPSALNIPEVRQKFYDVVDSCLPSDTLLVHLSGHGFVDRGSLFLLWGSTDLNRLLSTALPASDFLNALTYCKADSKLLILDCCHAGVALGGFGFKGDAHLKVAEVMHPENFLVLMASDHIEKAREIEELGGGFLSCAIRDALTSQLDAAIASAGSGGRLAIPGLKDWLERAATAHNNKFPALQVPIPYFFGKQRGDFYFSLGTHDWDIHKIELDDTEFVVLPVHPDSSGQAYCLCRHPVTNAEWKKVMDVEPIGQFFHQENEEWLGPFRPWDDPNFADPDKPVVCVSFGDALDYIWAKQDDRVTFRLTPRAVWDYAAFRRDSPPRYPRDWMKISPSLWYSKGHPASVIDGGSRTNDLGITDLIGNVWEWCGPTQYPSKSGRRTGRPEIRGGSFLDDLNRTRIDLPARGLEDGEETKHSDLGFRVLAMVPISSLPKELSMRLNACRSLDDDIRFETIAQDELFI